MLSYTVWGWNIGGEEKIRTQAIYDPENPFSLEFIFENNDGTMVSWEFARDMLIDVLENGVSGEVNGQISFKTVDEYIVMKITNEEGKYAKVEFSRGTFDLFVKEMLKMVPLGSESIDVSSIEDFANGLF